MPADLEGLLRYLSAGQWGQAADAASISAYGGEDALLANALKYDPGAHWQDVQNGDNGSGRSLVVDIEKLPASSQGKAGYDLRPANFKESEYLRDPSKVAKDDAYGEVTNSANFADDQEALWTKLAPLFVTMVAPMAGAALASAGIGGAGLTSAVTGSGLGAASELPKLVTQAIGKAPQYARQAANGGFRDPMSILGTIAGPAGAAAGLPSWMPTVGMTLGQLARTRLQKGN